MSLDGKLLGKARKRLEIRRNNEERARAGRREEAYRRDPKIQELDLAIRNTMLETLAAALNRGEDPVAAINAIRDKNLRLQAERVQRLMQAGLPGDWLEERFTCKRCRDTGYVDGEMCDCLRELYREEQRQELSRFLDLGEQRFEHFDLSLYDATPLPGDSVSPRRTMRDTFETCRNYAEKFTLSSPNLFFSGGTGLGKTFLSASIARVVSERGFSVYYDTAGAIFQRYEQEKFSRSQEDAEAARQELRRIENCDLLILDDLGTEMTTAFVTSAFYGLVNGRLTRHKPMIISTNLTARELAERYSPAIVSRLEGAFVRLRFTGRDIRRIKGLN